MVIQLIANLIHEYMRSYLLWAEHNLDVYGPNTA